ncbi:MAG TPA: PfkB family carbohydrate kinase [Pseudonocardiaceae bacterium]|nr:PfkB family carbohydrate kinase [Pseudonocardiaceae bacterium]
MIRSVPRQVGPLVVLGDALLDVDLLGEVHRQCPDAPAAPVLDFLAQRHRPGGAGLAALLAAADGVPVRLVTALADDQDAELLRGLLQPHVELVTGEARGSTVVKCRLRADGRTLARVDRGSGRAAPATPVLAEAMDGAGAVLVADYGRGLAADPLLRRRLTQLAAQVPVVWDPHPRGGPPARGCALATPNLAEARRAAGVLDPARAAARLRVRWGVLGVAVTLGADGALLHSGALRPGAAQSRLVPAPPVAAGDPCGAGDRFAVSAALALRAGRSPLAAVRVAVREASCFVAAVGGDEAHEWQAVPAHRLPLTTDGCARRRQA